MTLYTTYDSISPLAWRQLIERTRTATWFQTPEGYHFLDATRDYDPFVVAVEDGDRLVGLCVGQISRSRSRLVQYLTRRAIINGGPMLDEDITDEALLLLLQAVNDTTRERAIYTEIRCFHDYSRWHAVLEQAGWTYAAHLNFHIACEDHDRMWERLSENRRRQITKAQSLGVQIVQLSNEDDLRAWYQILKHLYRWYVHKPLPGLDFFRTLMREQVVLAVRAPEGGPIIGGAACVRLRGRALYEWYICGLDEQHKAYAPSVMATWAAMEYAHTNRLPVFDVMGAGVPDVPYGVRTFKQKFGGKLVEHGRWTMVAHSGLYRLGKMVYRVIFRKKS